MKTCGNCMGGGIDIALLACGAPLPCSYCGGTGKVKSTGIKQKTVVKKSETNDIPMWIIWLLFGIVIIMFFGLMFLMSV